MRGEYIASVAAICYALSSWRLLLVVGCGCLEVVDKGCEAIFGGEDAIFPSSSSYLFLQPILNSQHTTA